MVYYRLYIKITTKSGVWQHGHKNYSKNTKKQDHKRKQPTNWAGKQQTHNLHHLLLVAFYYFSQLISKFLNRVV